MMIIGERKPFAEITEMLGDNKNILVLGCGTCVSVCFAGGKKEAGILASELNMNARLKSKDLNAEEFTVERQCEAEFADVVRAKIEDADVVLSLACGIGVQTFAEIFPDKIILPGLNTTFIGWPVEPGVWVENCKSCGNCILHITDGVCPIARCPKNMLNGPCEGLREDGKCEVDQDEDCAWVLIYNRLKEKGNLDLFDKIQPAFNWQTAGYGGVRKIVRKDLTMEHMTPKEDLKAEPPEEEGDEQ